MNICVAVPDMIKLAMDMAKEMNAGYTLISAAHAGYLTPPIVIQTAGRESKRTV